MEDNASPILTPRQFHQALVLGLRRTALTAAVGAGALWLGGPTVALGAVGLIAVRYAVPAGFGAASRRLHGVYKRRKERSARARRDEPVNMHRDTPDHAKAPARPRRTDQAREADMHRAPISDPIANAVDASGPRPADVGAFEDRETTNETTPRSTAMNAHAANPVTTEPDPQRPPEREPDPDYDPVLPVEALGLEFEDPDKKTGPGDGGGGLVRERDARMKPAATGVGAQRVPEREAVVARAPSNPSEVPKVRGTEEAERGYAERYGHLDQEKVEQEIWRIARCQPGPAEPTPEQEELKAAALYRLVMPRADGTSGIAIYETVGGRPYGGHGVCRRRAAYESHRTRDPGFRPVVLPAVASSWSASESAAWTNNRASLRGGPRALSERGRRVAPRRPARGKEELP